MMIPRHEKDAKAVLFLVMTTVACQPHGYLDPALVEGEVLSTVEDDNLPILIRLVIVRDRSKTIACQYRSTDTLLCTLLLYGVSKTIDPIG
jgi:hypothetical protein